MVGGRRTVVGVALLGALAICGCYGSTEPATNVKFDSAQLNAQGTADSGPASTYFEYWRTSDPQAKVTTSATNWPAGASGAFSATINPIANPLYASTSYSFRVCGHDEGKPSACAQTRTFTTPGPTKDVVEGSWSQGPHGTSGLLQATSGPSAPTGTVYYNDAPVSTANYAGRVTCLSVAGNRAVVGTVGQVKTDGSSPNPNANPPTATLLATLVDGGPGVLDQVAVVLNPNSSTAPPCNAAANPPNVASQTINVYDAP